MIYFFYFLLFSFIFLTILGSFFIFYKIKCDHFYSLTVKKILKQTTREEEFFFSSLPLRKIISMLVLRRKKKLLLNLICGRYKSVCYYLEKTNKTSLSYLLLSHYRPDEAFLLLEEQIKKESDNQLLLSSLAELYFYNHDFLKTNLALKKIDAKNSYSYAKRLYIEAFFLLKEGDLFSVAEQLSLAVKIFKKYGAVIEEAKCYVLLATSYRACGIFDVAQFMFNSALKIYIHLSYPYGIVESYGNLGMLMSIQNRHEEALAFFDKAISHSKTKNQENLILNHKALSFILQKKINEANSILMTTISMYEVENNKAGLALSYEILALLKNQERDFVAAVDYSQKAAVLYKHLENSSAYLESSYLAAFSLYEISNLEKSEKICREIVLFAEKNQTNFHIANAYSLLGLIYIKKNDPQRAKSLFQKSLGFEQKNERKKEIATDYYNIALADYFMGHELQALDSLLKSLEFAQQSQDLELIKIIEEKISKTNQIK